MRRWIFNAVSIAPRRYAQGWVCQQCRSRPTPRWLHTAPPAEKPYYITSPIFYVNAEPHIGHLYTLVLTDVLKRWNVLLGKKAILCTGTDEHGMKIERAAAKAGQDARVFCDGMYKPFKTLAKDAQVDWDHFIRTSEPDHRFAVQHFWLMLRQRGLLYTTKHQGWYSVSDETFFPESAVHLALDPATGRKFMASKETGKEVEWTEEENYHFRLSRFKDRLLEFYKNNPNFVVPKTRMKDVIQEVTAGLQDLSVSRPRERLSWGIPVPDDESQTIYVWLDALINYLTKANYPFQVPGQEHIAGWPADCQVIGKDIVRFHCIYWPAFLMALDLPLPKRILTHAHWTLGNEKMSKSTGVVVNPFFAINRFGSDAMRYYLTLEGGIQNDRSYDNSFVMDRYRKGLQGGLGNLFSRIARAKVWNVRECLESSTGSTFTDLDHQFRSCLQQLPDAVAEDMEKPDPGDGLTKIMGVIFDTNAYLQQTQPWKGRILENKERLRDIIFLCAESLRICSILLQPFMPSKMKELLDQLGVSEDARMYDNAKLGSDKEYGPNEVGDIAKDMLFPPLSSYF